MKKNRMMRLASVLLVLVLLTTSVISGTFAKYTTQDSANDSARVAKWGVTTTVKGSLFGATYKEATENSIIAYDKSDGTVSSNKDAEDFLVAPGTKNEEGLTLSVVGTPEVKYQVVIDHAEDADGKNYEPSDISLNAGTYGVMYPVTDIVVNADNVGNYYYIVSETNKFATATAADTGKQLYELRDEVTSENQYLPIVWTVDIEGTEKTYTKTSEVMDALTGAFATTNTFAPNTPIGWSANVTWEWPFGTAWADVDADDDENTTTNDKLDTILGYMMAAHQETNEDYYVVAQTDGTWAYLTTGVVSQSADAANTIIHVIDPIKNSRYACLTTSLDVRVTATQVD